MSPALLLLVSLAAPPTPVMLAVPESTIRHLTASPDGRLVAVCFDPDDRGTLGRYRCFVYDARTGEKKHEVPDRAVPLHRPVAFSADGKHLFADGVVVELATGGVRRQSEDFPMARGLEATVMSADRKRLMIHSTQLPRTTFQVWDVNRVDGTAEVKVTVSLAKDGGERRWRTFGGLSADGRRLAYLESWWSGDRPNALVVVDVDSKKLVQNLPLAKTSPVHELAVAPDGSAVAVVQGDDMFDRTRVLKVWDVGTGRPRAAWPVWVSEVRYTASGRRVFGMNKDKTAVVFVDPNTGEVTTTVRPPFRAIGKWDAPPSGEWVVATDTGESDPPAVGIWAVSLPAK